MHLCLSAFDILLTVPRSTNKLLLWKTYQKAAAQRCAGSWSMRLTEYQHAEALPPNYCTRRPSIHPAKTSLAVGVWTLRWRTARTRCYDSSVRLQRAPKVLDTHTYTHTYTISILFNQILRIACVFIFQTLPCIPRTLGILKRKDLCM